jgi:hypothetical protein
MPSRKVLQFLANKKAKEKQEQNANGKLDKDQVTMSLELFYNITIQKCTEMLSNNETIPVIKVLKKMVSDGYDIDYIIIRLLSHGNLLFYQFIKQSRRDLLNHFEAYDEITHTCKSSEIIDLLKYDILELELATKINGMDTLADTIYMFMQLMDYNDVVKSYLMSRYSGIATEEGILRHMVLYNIPHEVAVYLKSLNGKSEFDEKLINFNKIMKSYRVMEINFQGSDMLKSRLINVINMVVDSVVNKGMELPSREEFTKHFEARYQIKNKTENEKPLFLQLLPWDFYWFISIEIIQQRAIKLFPYEGVNGKWV